MMGHMAMMNASAPIARRAPSVYEAVGLLDDPFPRDPRAGAYVALPSQSTVLAGVRAWLALGSDDAVGLAVVAGAAGSGKTRLLEQLVLAIADDDRLIGVVPGDGARRTDASLLRSAIGSLGGTPGGRTGLELTSELREIVDAHREDLLPPVLLIDNAALTGSQLEILRGVLTQPERVAHQTRVQIVLLGPAALPDRIARRRSLAELTRYVATIPPLEVDEARALLNGRIEAVRDPLGSRTEQANPFFDERALEALLEASGGMPDALLALAHAAVREAIATGRRRVDAVTAQAVTQVLPAQGEAPSQAREMSLADPVIQTRLSLPGMDIGDEPAPASRRREQQR